MARIWWPDELPPLAFKVEYFLDIVSELLRAVQFQLLTIQPHKPMPAVYGFLELPAILHLGMECQYMCARFVRAIRLLKDVTP